MWPISNGCSWSCDAKSPKKTKERYVKTRDACEKWIFPNIGFMRWIPIGVIFCGGSAQPIFTWVIQKRWFIGLAIRCQFGQRFFLHYLTCALDSLFASRSKVEYWEVVGHLWGQKAASPGWGEVEKKINRAKMRAFVGLQRSVQAKASFMVWRAICVLSTQITLLCLAYNESCSGWKMAANFDLFLESSWSLALSIVIWSCSGHNSRSEAITL